MKVTELDTSAYPQIISGTPTESGAGRSEGTLHLSTVYKDMEEEALIQRRRTATPEELMWYAAGGYLWERAMSLAYRDAIKSGDLVRPDEWTKEGLTGSPDLIDVANWRVIELKCRWQNAQRFDSLEKNYWLEIVQVMGYCYLIGTQEAELYVFFVCGNWRPPVPMVRAVRLTFSQIELADNWQMLLAHARRKGMLKT